MILSILLAVLGLVGSTAFHYEAISFLDQWLDRRASVRRVLPVLIAGLVTAHLVEIAFYAALFMLATGPLGLGGFTGDPVTSASSYVYFAAETYSSLGYGDIVPTDGLRLIASIEPLNGLLLLTWSGAFLYAVVHSSERRR